jgi:hypothetical protein
MAIGFRYTLLIACIGLLLFAHHAHAFGAGSECTPGASLLF